MLKMVIVILSLLSLVGIYLFVRVSEMQKQIESSLEIKRLTVNGLIVSFNVSDKLIKHIEILQSANLISSVACGVDDCTVTIRIISLDDLEVYFYGQNTFFRINLKEIIKNKLANE